MAEISGPEMATPAESVTVTPDGRRLLAVHKDVIRIWKLSDRSLERTISLDTALSLWIRTHAIDISLDGKLLAVATGGTLVRMWNLNTGKELFANEPTHQVAIRSMDWSADGKYIASCAFDGKVIVWDAQTGEVLNQFIYSKGTANLRSISFSPNSRFVAAGGNHFDDKSYLGGLGVFKVWDIITGKQVREFQHTEGTYDRFAFSTDGRTLIVALNSNKSIASTGASFSM
jgi:WD40 repeat protein